MKIKFENYKNTKYTKTVGYMTLIRKVHIRKFLQRKPLAEKVESYYMEVHL